MLSSTSSSSQRIDASSWATALVLAATVTAALLGALEWSLAAKGFRATIVDSEAEWARQRLRASRLGPKALVLIGASRMQLDLDLGVLRNTTRLEPVQLAIYGASFLPILKGLAEDDRINGTVLVDFVPQAITASSTTDVATDFERGFVGSQSGRLMTFRSSEGWLTGKFRGSLRSYADGASPLTSLVTRVLDRDATPQYLVTLPDRSQLADYRMVAMPSFYFTNVLRNLAGPLQLPESLPVPERERMLTEAIAKVEPVDNRPFVQNLDGLRTLVRRIESRGGRVIFLNLPTSGLVRDTDRARYPRALFWDQLSGTASLRTFNVDDDSQLAAFDCPDGSHLDFREREAFTRALVGALELDRGQTPSSR